MKYMPFLLAFSLSCLSMFVFAEQDREAKKAALAEEYGPVVNGLKQAAPDLVIDSIKSSPVPGLYLVLSGTDVLYVSEDGRYVISGDMYDVLHKENLSEKAKSHVRAEALGALGSEDFIEFAPEVVKHTIYAFTDINCGYCRKLHQDVPELNDNGIAVRYLAYPRSGVNSTGAYELAAVWCADDRNKALSDAKSGIVRDDIKECDDPVARQYVLGQELGVRGTPAIFMENGRAIPGYFPPKELTRIVGQQL